MNFAGVWAGFSPEAECEAAPERVALSDEESGVTEH